MVSIKRHAIIALVATMFLASIGSSVYFFGKWQQEKNRATNPTEAAQKEARELVSKVGKFMDLPAGEEPTIANIVDPTKLANQAFFAKAKKGDKVLIYTNAKLAILYDSSANRILNVAPVNIGSPSAALGQEVRFVLYNGTGVTGLTRQYEVTLKEKVPGAVVADRDNAKKRDYQRSVLIDIVGDKSSQARELGNTLGLTVLTLPEGEATPSADFLIILGTDQVK